MRTVYVNETYLKDKEVVRAFIVVPKTIEESIKILFDEKIQMAIPIYIQHQRTKAEGGFHFFTRFCQYVIYFNYDDTTVEVFGKPMKIGISIEVLYFGVSPNVNDAFDYVLKLRETGWGEKDRDEILKIAHQIKKDMPEQWFEIAEMKVKDPPNEITSYLL